MIQSIRIEKLFGRFTYKFNLVKDGVTIITGPNGFGKSTILRIINAISKGNLIYFFNLDFSKLKIEFDNGKQVEITKEKDCISVDNIEYPICPNEIDEYSEYIHPRPWIRRTPNGFYDRRTEEFFTEEEYFQRVLFEDDYYFEWISSKKKRGMLTKLKEKLDQIQSWCGEVRYISDQRLIRMKTRRQDDSQIVDVIGELPSRLKAEISRVAEEYSRVANALDSSYPRRLFAAKEGINNQDEYQKALQEVNEKFAKLNEYNLVDMSIIDEENYNSTYSTALKIYFDDFAEKYKVFQDLIAKLDLFTKIINNRLAFKRIKITRDTGFEIVDNDNPNKKLQLSQLSSGEKQEIVLFYDLIFDTKEKLLLLIDEPEISLHITWQKKFLDDLLEVSKQIKLQAVVATHSPQIVSNHLDIQIDLGELYGTELNSF